MLKRLKNMMRISTKFDVGLITYGIALGSIERGADYADKLPDAVGYVVLGCSALVAFIAGIALVDYIDLKARLRADQDAQPHKL